MAEGFLSVTDAGAEIGKLFAAPADGADAPPAEAEEKREVKFTARVKGKKAKAADAPIPLTPADGSPDPDAELEPEPAKAEAPDAEDAEEVPAEEPDTEDAPAPRMHTVKVDGIEIEVDEDELKKGYSRTKDYTRKTQALAEERKRFEEQEVAKVREERRQYAERLAALAAVVQLPGEEPNWEDLRDRLSSEDFTQQFTEWRNGQRRMAQVRAEQERIAALEAEEQQRTRAQRLAAEKERLETALPVLKDPDRGKQYRDDLIAYAKSVGFTDDELAAVEDHRPLLLLDKARKWDEAEKRKPTIEKKIDRALETMKPSGPAARPRTTAVERAQQSLAKTGSVEDAATVINALMAPKKKSA